MIERVALKCKDKLKEKMTMRGTMKGIMRTECSLNEKKALEKKTKHLPGRESCMES